jgi:hypothetical protein
MNFLRYFKLLGLFKDAVSAYKEEEGKDKAPAILHRRVFGAIILLVGTGIGIYFGVETDILAGHLNAIIDNVDKLISAVIALYGIIQIIVGLIKRKRDAPTG